MTTEPLTCPYCNAALGVSASLSPGQRIVCPRCGDTFPLRPADAFTSRSADKPAATISPTLPEANLSLRSRRRNGLVAALVVGVMLLMAGGGLAFMLLTQPQRRAQDTSRPPRRPGRQRGEPEPDNLPPVVARVSPDKLAALGYVPAGVNVLFGARIPELLASPAGARILRDPIRVGGAEYRLEALPGWVGFHLEDIDHLVFAARVEDALIPPFYLVLRTVQPYDEERLRQRLQGKRVASAGKKKLYAFHLPQQKNLPLHVWLADERTVVMALFADQLESLPSRPVEGLQQLPEEVRTVLKQRREPVAPVWIVGHARDWSKTSAAKFLQSMKKENLQKLAPLRTFGIWIVPDEIVEIKGVFACKDEAGARELEEYFLSLRSGDKSFKTALEGPWLTLQFRSGADFLTRWLTFKSEPRP